MTACLNALFPMAFMAVGILTVWLGMVLIVCHIWNWLRPKPEGEIHRSFMIGWSYAMAGLFLFGAIFWD